MTRTLIVARMDAARAPEVARLFEESDSTELPHLIGVSQRSLFSFHDLYFHLIEAGDDLRTRLHAARTNPLYSELNEQLSEFIKPYSPDWRGPADAMARSFYSWQAA